MEELEKNIMTLFKEEHQDWVRHIKEAETSGEGIDLNLGGNFAERVEGLMTAFRDFKTRTKQKRGKIF